MLRNSRMFVAVLFAISGLVVAEDPSSVSVSLAKPRRAVFGGAEVAWTAQVAGPVPADARLVWGYSAHQRTLGQGESPIAKRAMGPATSTLAFQIPRLREGVPLETQLVGSIISGTKNLAQFTQSVWILPDDPFLQREEWLKSLDLKLYDPEGKTEKHWAKTKFPIARITGRSGLEDSSGLLIVGEGLSLKRNKSLGELLLRRSSRGGRTLWIAPREGVLPFPTEITEGNSQIESLTLQREGVIRTLDKRLDFQTWQREPFAAVRYRVAGERNAVMLTAGEDATGWPWLDVQYASGGRLIVCGFCLAAAWEDGPTSRYLFARILETLSGDPVPADANHLNPSGVNP